MGGLGPWAPCPLNPALSLSQRLLRGELSRYLAHGVSGRNTKMYVQTDADTKTALKVKGQGH